MHIWLIIVSLVQFSYNKAYNNDLAIRIHMILLVLLICIFFVIVVTAVVNTTEQSLYWILVSK